MNKLVMLFSSLDGRTGRRQFWFGVLLIIVFALIASSLLLALGLGQTVSGTGTVQVDGGAPSQYSFFQTTLNPWAALAVSLIVAFPWLAILVKRRHDRNNSGLDAKIIVGLSIFVQVIQTVGVAVEASTMGILGLIMAIASIYLLIVCGVLKGTNGPNAYGPDPLAPASAA